LYISFVAFCQFVVELGAVKDVNALFNLSIAKSSEDYQFIEKIFKKFRKIYFEISNNNASSTF